MGGFINNISIAKRIAIGFGLILLLAGVGGGTVLFKMNELSSHLSDIVGNYNVKIQLATDVRDEGRKRAESIRDMLLTADEDKLILYKADFDRSVELYSALILQLDERISDEQEGALMDRIRKSSAATFPVMNVMMQNILDGIGEDSIETLQSEGAALQSELLSALNEFVILGQDRINEGSAKAEQAAKDSFIVVLSVSGLIFVFILLVWYLLSRSMTIPLQGIVRLMQELRESGDFSVRCKDYGKSELGQVALGFNELMDSLQVNIDAIRQGMREVANGDLSARIESDAKGDLAELRDSINGTVDELNDTVNAIREIMQNVALGNFDRLVESDAKGDLADLSVNVNDSISSLNTAISSIDEVMGAVAKGDFSVRVEVALSGDLAGLRSHLNKSLDALSEALDDSVEVAVAQSEGDLSSRINGNHEGQLGVLQGAINASQDKVSGAISEITKSAVTVADAGEQIYRTSSDLSQRTQEQAASIEETAASMEEMTASVKQNSDNAGQADQLAINARDLAEGGGSVMDRATTAMNAISVSSQKISDIIDVIDGIAFQTNLLALNAAVEAARAGEQGRGFAVVAGEVRTLAQRSADAAKEISTLIADSADKVKEGTVLVDEAGHSLQEIVHSIKKVSDIVAEIAAASAEQTTGIEQVNNAIAQMESLTQDNVSLVERAASASESMSQQAAGMKGLVSFFTVDGLDISSGASTAEDSSSFADSTTAQNDVEVLSPSPSPSPSPSTASAAPALVSAATAAGDTEWAEF